MIFSKYSEEEIRSFCRQNLETLEYWLRQIIDEGMKAVYGANYLDATDNGGSPLMPTKRIASVKDRYDQNKFFIFE